VPIRILLVAAVLATAFWGLRRLFAGYGPRPVGTVLAAREWALVEAASEAMFPAGGPVPPSGEEAGVPAFVDRYVASVPPGMRRLVRLLLLLFEQATLILPAPGAGGRRRFSDLPLAQRAAVFEAWRTSRLFARRLSFTSLRALLCMGYLADPAVLRELGLAPFEITPPIARADLLYPPIGRPRSEIRYRETTPPSDGTPLEIGGPIDPAYRGSGASS